MPLGQHIEGGHGEREAGVEILPHAVRDPLEMAHQVVYLHHAEKYHRLTCRLSKEQKGLKEKALMASQRPSEPWRNPRSEPCGRTSPAQTPSHGCFPRPCVLTPPLAAATAARERAGLSASSTPDGSPPPPSPVSAAATAWPSPSRWSAGAVATACVGWHGASRNYHRHGTTPTAAASPPLPCRAWRRDAQ